MTRLPPFPRRLSVLDWLRGSAALVMVFGICRMAFASGADPCSWDIRLDTQTLVIHKMSGCNPTVLCFPPATHCRGSILDDEYGAHWEACSCPAGNFSCILAFRPDGPGSTTGSAKCWANACPDPQICLLEWVATSDPEVKKAECSCLYR